MEKIPLSKVIPDPNQPRKYFEEVKIDRLVKSIEKNGIINPLIVEKTKEGYLIVDGERRFRAAKAAGFKEVPVVVKPTTEDVNRIVEQFNIQEQHEGWTPVEKAGVVLELKNKYGKSTAQISERLGIPLKTVQDYADFDQIENKADFINGSVSLGFARAINNIKRYALNIKTRNLEVLSPETRSNIEKVMIKKIKSGEIQDSHDFAKLKDAFRTDHTTIGLFGLGASTVEELYVNSKAKGMYHLRNAMSTSVQVGYHIDNFMKYSKGIEVSETEVLAMKNAMKHLQKFIGEFDTE